ncbi:hypothetical protein J6590_035184, partial [Homalodisca vitripennis]
LLPKTSGLVSELKKLSINNRYRAFHVSRLSHWSYPSTSGSSSSLLYEICITDKKLQRSQRGYGLALHLSQNLTLTTVQTERVV